MEERLKCYLKRMEGMLQELEQEESRLVCAGGGENCKGRKLPGGGKRHSSGGRKPPRDLGSARIRRLRREKEELLVQIGFFQQERLAHLIVTVLFAVLAMIAFAAATAAFSPWLGLLLILLLALLLPYIRHYYILENGVQKLYRYYDRLEDALSRESEERKPQKLHARFRNYSAAVKSPRNTR